MDFVNTEDSLFNDVISDLCQDEFMSTGDWMEHSLNTQFDGKLNNSSASKNVFREFNDSSQLLFEQFQHFDDDDLEDDDFDDIDIESKDVDRKRKRSRPNPDAEIIAAATEKNLRMLNLDPNSKEGKKLRRKIRNRMSAQLHRERKAHYIQSLEGMVKDRDTKILELQTKLRNLTLDNERLKGQLRMLFPNTDSSDDESFLDNILPPINLSFKEQERHKSQADQDSRSGVTSNSSRSSAPDYYESDTTSSIPSQPNSPTHIPSFYRAGVSVFSFLMMLGVTLFSDQSVPISNRITDITIPHVQFEMPFVNEYTSSPFSLEQYPTSSIFQRGLPTLEDPTNALRKESPPQGRVLLSSLPRDIETPPQRLPHSMDSLIIPKFPQGFPILPSVPSRSTALWKYQDSVVQLFPHLVDAAETLEPQAQARTDRPSRSTSRKHRHNLRSRRLEADSHGEPSGDLSPKERALVLASSSAYTSEYHRGPSGEVLGVRGSHILVTEGRALFDLDLLPSRFVPTDGGAAASKGSSEDDITASRAMSIAAPPIWNAHSEVSAVVPSPPRLIAVHPDVKSHGNSNPRFFSSLSQDPTKVIPRADEFSAGMQGAPVLMMLVPASSIRWGSSWEHASGDAFENILHAHRSSDGGANSSDLWVEIGCSVFRAELVSNVTLS